MWFAMVFQKEGDTEDYNTNRQHARDCRTVIETITREIRVKLPCWGVYVFLDILDVSSDAFWTVDRSSLAHCCRGPENRSEEVATLAGQTEETFANKLTLVVIFLAVNSNHDHSDVFRRARDISKEANSFSISKNRFGASLCEGIWFMDENCHKSPSNR